MFGKHKRHTYLLPSEDTDQRRRIGLENKAFEVLEDKQRVFEETQKQQWAETVAARRVEEETLRLRGGPAASRSTLRAVGLSSLEDPASSTRSGASFRSGTGRSTSTSTLRSTARSGTGSVLSSSRRDEVESLMATYMKEAARSREAEAKLAELERQLEEIRKAQGQLTPSTK